MAVLEAAHRERQEAVRAAVLEGGEAAVGRLPDNDVLAQDAALVQTFAHAARESRRVPAIAQESHRGSPSLADR